MAVFILSICVPEHSLFLALRFVPPESTWWIKVAIRDLITNSVIPFSKVKQKSNKFLPEYLDAINIFLTFAAWKKKIYSRAYVEV